MRECLLSARGGAKHRRATVSMPTPAKIGDRSFAALNQSLRDHEGSHRRWRRKAWLRLLQRADDKQETELITIERNGDGAPPVIECTHGVRIIRTSPASTATEPTETA